MLLLEQLTALGVSELLLPVGCPRASVLLLSPPRCAEETKGTPMLFSRDPNTIFRGNSLTSKCIDETMKLAGMHYLHVTLKPTIEEVGPWAVCGRSPSSPLFRGKVRQAHRECGASGFAGRRGCLWCQPVPGSLQGPSSAGQNLPPSLESNTHFRKSVPVKTRPYMALLPHGRWLAMNL